MVAAYPGLSKLEYFAAAAMTGLLASTANPNSTGSTMFGEDKWARLAFDIADAMCAEAERRDKEGES